MTQTTTKPRSAPAQKVTELTQEQATWLRVQHDNGIEPDASKAKIILDMLANGGTTQAISRQLWTFFPDITRNEQAAPVGTLLSDVAPTNVTWIWKDRLALGKMAMLDGDPGLGKSIISLDLAARLSTGRNFPGDDMPPHRGGTVLITPEDGLADTIQPRLAKAGADLSKIVSIGTVPVYDKETGTFQYERPFTLPDDLPLLEQAVMRVDAKLLIIDPVMSILGTQNTYKDNDVRALLTPVQMLAERVNFAVIMVRHLNKGGGENALYRGGGSIAFAGLCRMVHMVARDPGDEDMCVFANIKNNLRKTAPSLSYCVVDDKEQGNDERPYIHWQGINSITARDILSSPAKPSANRQEIIRLLTEAGKPLTPLEIWQHLSEDNPDVEQNNVRTTLKRMKDAKQLGSPAYGVYAIPL